VRTIDVLLGQCAARHQNEKVVIGILENDEMRCGARILSNLRDSVRVAIKRPSYHLLASMIHLSIDRLHVFEPERKMKLAVSILGDAGK
jgi:hypothetical protein